MRAVLTKIIITIPKSVIFYLATDSVGSKDRMEPDRRADTTDRITFPANVVGKKFSAALADE